MQHGFESDFRKATGESPFPFQRAFAGAKELPELINVPTGLGKTAMAVVGWLWRRFGAGDEVRRKTPRRLVYCLPMRVLVEQTRDNAIRWLHNLSRLGGAATFDPPVSAGEHATPKRRLAAYTPSTEDPKKVAVFVLMGGEDEDDWDIHPEREAIIIGTQDMLLSRALNRGYAASRARWPMQFGLLHADCLWVFDEIQLMGAGLATTAQLEAFRQLRGSKNGHGCRSVWMSATLRPDWLKTVDYVDYKDRVAGPAPLSLSDEDRENDQVKQRWNASKRLTKAKAAMGDAAGLAKEIVATHKLGTRTIVVVNTVRRACDLFAALRNGAGESANGGKKKGRAKSDSVPELPLAPDPPAPSVVLLHSRFRPADRKKRVEEALADIAPNGPGTIIVSTQVIEAGVDVSAATLFTELAPWASLVQRFGRCNRRGKYNDSAAVYWVAMPARGANAAKIAAPYELEDLTAAAEQLKKLKDVGLKSLPEVKLHFEHGHVIRCKDLIELFDTTPDLAGNDIDIDRFVREVEDSDVRVFWRDYGDPKKGATPNKVHGVDSQVEPAPRREELCPAPIGEFRDFAKKHPGQVWRWNFLDQVWEKVDATRIAPGQVFLVHADAGGYSAERGWDAKSADRVEPVPAVTEDTGEAPDGTDDDRYSRICQWETIGEHTDKVCQVLVDIIGAAGIAGADAEALRRAARYHDWGKAHEIFQSALPDGVPDRSQIWAKAMGVWKPYDRRHFRHELASALAVLQRPHDSLKSLTDDELDLVAYLIAAHHGKVRLSIRSLPNEIRPRDAEGSTESKKRFARGVWDGDALPATDLGGGVTAPAVTLSLEPMELGLCAQPPFAGQPSWAERMIRLRDKLGPFRLAYLEAILRAADMCASKAAEQRAAPSHRVGTSADVKEADHG